jgi:hypothetical protein
MTPIQSLENAALDAYRDGMPWTSFWQDHAADVLRLPDDEARSRLIGRLFSIVTSGDAPALMDADEPPAPLIDAPSPHDYQTAARCLWQPEEAR